MNRLKISYFFREHRKELITFVATITAALIGYFFHKDPGNIFFFTMVSTVFFSVLTLYFILREKDFYYISLDNYKDKEEWFGSGKFDYDKTNSAYLVADTEAGYIFSKSLLWSDYIFEGDFKILNDCLGVIVRAVNSSNYLMLQIRKDCIRPHIRINGYWMAFEPSKTGLKFQKNITDGRWCKFLLKVKGELIEIKVYDKKDTLINKTWKIENGRISTPIFDKNDDVRRNHTHILDLTVSSDYGSVGFRNTQDERALVKNLLIENINSKR